MTSEKRNAVVFCTDAGMIFPTLVAADEAATAVGAEGYDVLVVAQTGCLPPDFSRWHENRGHGFQVIEMDIIGPSLKMGFRHRPRITLAAVFRLHIPRLFRDKYERILTLDGDIEIRRPFTKLFSLDMSGHPFAAADGLGLAPPDGAGMPGRRTLVLMHQAGWHCASKNPKYANTGVMLIDINNWLDQAISERALNYLTKNFEKSFLDQDAINVAVSGEYCRLSPAWNYLDDVLREFRPPFDPVILHYAGGHKPWDTLTWRGDPHASERYRRFFADTPWPDAPPIADWQKKQAARGEPKRHPGMTPDRNKNMRAYLKNTRFADVEQGLIEFRQLD